MNLSKAMDCLDHDLVGIPQGSVLGAFLFIIFINDIFLLVNDTEVCNYADDTNIFACHSDVYKFNIS